MSNEDIETLMINSTRYCLGRRSYAVGEHCAIVRRNWSHLSDKAKWVISNDVEEALQEGRTGMDMDRREWENLAELWR